nr:MAG TPA: hypothetical protein [Crassvirales sp.]
MDDTVLHNMKIPIDWVCSYRQIQFLLMEYGISAIAGCDNVCNNKNKNIIQLWNLFKNAVYVYNTDDIEQANRIYNFIVDNLKNYEDINVGSSKIVVEDSEVEIICTGDNYKFTDTETSYTFKANDDSQLDIKDNGLGQTIYFNITSQKTITIGSKKETFSIGYNFILDNDEDYSWISYSDTNNTLIIRENKATVRTATFKLIQAESGNVLTGKISQEVNSYGYRYTITYEPESIKLPAEGGSAFFTVDSYKELVNNTGEVIGDKIPVSYIAESSSIYFKVEGNKVSADANTEEIRSAAIIIKREEIGVSGNKKIELFQDSLNKEIRYTLKTNIDTNTIDANGSNPVTLTVESYKETYINGVSKGDKTDVSYTVISDKGLLKNNTSDKTKWYMPANDSTNIRNDSLIVKQLESNKTEIINIRQDGAEEEVDYIFSVDQESITSPSTGQNIILNVQSYKQHYVNNKPTSKTPIQYTGSVISGNDFVSIQDSLPNSITVAPNDGESERNAKILYTQQDGSDKTIEVRITQTGASVRYEYHLSLNRNEVNLNRDAHNETITVSSYRQKYINDSPDGGPEDVNYYLQQISGNANESQYGSVNAAVQDNSIYVTSNLNLTDQQVSIQYEVIQNVSSGSPNKVTLTINKAASEVRDEYSLEVRINRFEIIAYPDGERQYFEITRAERKHIINGQVNNVESNLTWEPSSDSSWLHVGGQNENYILCDENTVGNTRTGHITVRLVANTNTTVEITVTQKAATFNERRVVELDHRLFKLTPQNYSEETNYKLLYQKIRNNRVVEETDETDNYKNNGLYCHSVSGCGVKCLDWNFTANSIQKTIGVAFVGSYTTEERLVAKGSYRTQNGLYTTVVSAIFVADNMKTLDSNYYNINDDNSIYDFFYHSFPKEYKCIYTDLIKIFINSHDDNYKLRKAVYHINLFQSLIAAHFFNDIKKIKLFFDCIINYLNNYFKDNDIHYEYHINGIEENGHVYIDIIPCQRETDVKLELNPITGHLYEKDNSKDTEAIEFEVEDSHLILTKYGYTK